MSFGLLSRISLIRILLIKNKTKNPRQYRERCGHSQEIFNIIEGEIEAIQPAELDEDIAKFLIQVRKWIGHWQWVNNEHSRIYKIPYVTDIQCFAGVLWKNVLYFSNSIKKKCISESNACVRFGFVDCQGRLDTVQSKSVFFSLKILVIHIINSLRHRKCFVQGFIHSMFVQNSSLARTSLVRDLAQTSRE